MLKYLFRALLGKLKEVSFVFVLLYSVFGIILPFILYNNLLAWDTAGLYYSALYHKTNIFPNFIGWNPYFFLGYPQNQFYSPLFSYLTSILSFAMPFNFAFKFVVLLIIILTPISFYLFSRSFNLSKRKSAISMVAMFSLLFIGGNIGGNWISAFKIGLLTHSFGLMIFFFYASFLNKGLKEKKFVIPSFLFVLLILAHIISAFVGAIYLSSFIICNARDKNKLKFIFKHILLVFLLSAFWTIPFLAKFGYTSAVSIGNLKYVVLLIISFLILTTITVWKKETDFYPITVFAILTIFLSVLQLITNLIPIHFYRITLFLLLMLPILIINRFENNYYLFFILLVSIIFIIVAPPIQSEGVSNMNKLTPINVSFDGRVFIVASIETSPHILQNVLPFENNFYAIKGLYVESSKNALFLLNAERLIDNKSIFWGTHLMINISNNVNYTEILDNQFRLFNINYVIFTDNRFGWEKLSDIYSFYHFDPHRPKLEKQSYSLYRVGNSSLIDVLNYTPRVIGKDYWDDNVFNWLFSDDIKNGILVNEPVPSYIGSGNEDVKILKIDSNYQYINFEVNSTQDVPILIKISEFPNWHAYQDGKRLKIYRASPYLMLIYGKGNIELEYENTWADLAGLILSIIGIVYLLISLRK